MTRLVLDLLLLAEKKRPSLIFAFDLLSIERKLRRSEADVLSTLSQSGVEVLYGVVAISNPNQSDGEATTEINRSEDEEPSGQIELTLVNFVNLE